VEKAGQQINNSQKQLGNLVSNATSSIAEALREATNKVETVISGTSEQVVRLASELTNKNNEIQQIQGDINTATRQLDEIKRTYGAILQDGSVKYAYLSQGRVVDLPMTYHEVLSNGTVLTHSKMFQVFYQGYSNLKANVQVQMYDSADYPNSVQLRTESFKIPVKLRTNLVFQTPIQWKVRNQFINVAPGEQMNPTVDIPGTPLQLVGLYISKDIIFLEIRYHKDESKAPAPTIAK
jgi:soluble cytochrome b562